MAGYRTGSALTGYRPGVGPESTSRAGDQRTGRDTPHGVATGYATAGNGNGNGHVKSASAIGGSTHEHGNGTNGNGTNGTGNGNGNGNGHGTPPGPGEIQVRSATAKEQLFEILHVVFKRWRLIAGLFVVVALSGLLAVLSRGPRFAATGKVMITSDRADAVIQPTEQDSLALMKLNDAMVNSETHLIQSRELLEQVIRGLALAKAGGNVVNIATAADDRETIGLRAQALALRLKVTPIRNTNVIQIDLFSGDPSSAAQLVNRIIDEYIAYHAMVHSPQGLSGFYEEQSSLLMQNLRRAEETLSDFTQREGIVSPAAELQAAVTNIASMDAELRSRNAAIVGVEEKLRVVRDQLAAQPEIIKRVQQLEVNPVITQLREHLIDREVDQVALLRKYTDSDRHVRDNQTEISELTQKLNKASASEPLSVSSESFSANPVYEARLTALLELEAELREDRARKVALEEDLSRDRRELVALKQRALEFDHLDQEVQRHRAAFDLYTRRQQEATIEDALNQRKLVNVAVVQRPGLPLQRTDDPRIPLALAIISGLAVSFGGAFGLEYLNRTLRFERDVERYLGLPVIGTVAEAKE
jgi:succinoglycan biosynthesis transport protein ExoP